MKKPNVAGVLGALAVGEHEADAQQQARTAKAATGRADAGKVGRPRTDRVQYTITLSPVAVEIVERELLTRMQNKNLRPSERRPGPTIEALILEADASRRPGKP
jgi:hypothetical protein